MLNVTVALPSFLLEVGRLIVNVPVSVGETPDSAAAASVAAMLTLAVAAPTGRTTEFHPMARPNNSSANLNRCCTVERCVEPRGSRCLVFILSNGCGRKAVAIGCRGVAWVRLREF